MKKERFNLKKGDYMFHIDPKTEGITQLEVVDVTSDGSYVVKDVSPRTEPLKERLSIAKEIVTLLDPKIKEEISQAIVDSLAQRNRITKLTHMRDTIKEAKSEEIKIKGGEKHCFCVEVRGEEFIL